MKTIKFVALESRIKIGFDDGQLEIDVAMSNDTRMDLEKAMVILSIAASAISMQTGIKVHEATEKFKEELQKNAEFSAQHSDV